MTCPDENELLRFFHGQVAPAVIASLEAHLDACEDCRSVLSAAGEERRASAVLAPGDRLGRYELERVAGEGAMGRVYVARDLQLGRRVALKVIHAPGTIADDGSLARRAIREAQAMARLSHPNVVTVFDAGVEQGAPFVAMELSEGQTLGRWLASRRRTASEIVAVFAQIADGLQAAHDAGIVHRDIKPQNILVEPSGKARLTDFGLAFDDAPVAGADLHADLALTRTGALVGTPAYMAPEHFDGRANAQSDQFSLCATLYEAFAGHRPFAGDSVEQLRTAAASGAPVRPANMPRWLHAVVRRGLSPDPGQRFTDLRALQAHLLRRRSGVRRWVLGPVAALLAITAVAVAWSVHPQPTTAARRITDFFAEPELGSRPPLTREGGRSAPAQLLTLRVGEQRRVEMHGLERVSIGAPEIADISVAEGGNAVEVVGVSSGRTTLLLWSADRRAAWHIEVTPSRGAPR